MTLFKFLELFLTLLCSVHLNCFLLKLDSILIVMLMGHHLQHKFGRKLITLLCGDAIRLPATFNTTHRE